MDEAIRDRLERMKQEAAPKRKPFDMIAFRLWLEAKRDGARGANDYNDSAAASANMAEAGAFKDVLDYLDKVYFKEGEQ